MENENIIAITSDSEVINKSREDVHMLLTFVIPCYNEEEVLPLTYHRITQLGREFIDKGLIKDFELVMVNDGSEDQTLSILKDYAKKDERVKVISLSKNFGAHIATMAGLHWSKGDATLIMGADLQEPFETIEEMVQKYHEGFDIVFGVRKVRHKETFFRRKFAEGFYFMINVMGGNIVPHCGIRLISRRALSQLIRFKEIVGSSDGLITRLGFKQTKVFYNEKERLAGKSKYNYISLFTIAWETISSLTYVPLHFATITGLFFSSMAFLYASYLIIARIFLGMLVEGWTSIMVAILFMGGVQLVFLGLLGEYLGRVYMEVKGRPLYIVEELINLEGE